MIEIKTRCCGAVICSGRTVAGAVSRAIWDGESLAYADLRGADLCHVVFGYTNLRCADLRDADLRHAYLRDADITGALFEGADITGANISPVWETAFWDGDGESDG